MKISMERWEQAQNEEINHHQGGSYEEHEQFTHRLIAKYLNFNYEKTFTDIFGHHIGHIYKGGSERHFHGADCYYGTWYADNNI
jgi:hypothetical protein